MWKIFTHYLITLTFGLLKRKTCPNWTIYSWQGFNSLVWRPMLKTNYRCAQSLNISVDVAKCMENVHKFTQYTHICPLQKTTCPNWTIYSWQGFNSLVCPLMLKTNYWCIQSLNISVDVAKCSQFQPVHSLLSVKKNDLSWLNNLFMARFQLISMSSYAKNKLQMCSVTQHQCRRRQMCGKCSHINSLHSLFVRYK